MPKAVRELVFQRFCHAAGDGFLILLETSMDGSQHEIKLLKHGARVIKVAVRQNVYLCSAEDSEICVTGIEPFYFLQLFTHRLHAEPAGDFEALGVVGYYYPLVAAALRLRGHFLDGIFAVAICGV